MNAKAFLKQYELAKKRVEEIKEQLADLNDQSTNITQALDSERVQTTPEVDKIGRIVAAKVDLANELVSAEAEEEEGAEKPGLLLRWLVPFIAFCIAVLAAVHLGKPVEAEMQRIVDDAVEEVMSEGVKLPKRGFRCCYSKDDREVVWRVYPCEVMGT